VTPPVIQVRVRNGPAVAHYPAGASLGPRVLPCFEFVWMLNGRASWEYTRADAEPTSVPLRPGMLLLSRPDLRERYLWDPDHACAHAYVTFYADGPACHPEQYGGWPVTRELSEPLAGLCRYLIWLSGIDSASAAARSTAVLGWLLDLFISGPLDDEADAVLPEQVLRLGDHLRAVWQDGTARSLSLNEMAMAARVSPGHLARVFRQRFQISPVAAVELIRLARAAILLQRSGLAVGEVAAACGFVSPFHFSRRFRAAYGVAPRTYRTSLLQDPLDPVRQAGLAPLARQLLGESE
jgi:AraC family transcriptional regulator